MPFSDVKGHQRAVEALMRDVARGTVAKAYLFAGEEGIGKHFVAVKFAQAINCLKGKGDACAECASCLKIERMQHPDVFDICAEAADIKIEQVRELKKRVSLRPYEGRKKVVIINDAHQFTDDASNAALKTLEEPPQDSVFVLVTSKPNLLFKTIVSRCRLLRFSPLRREELEELLKREHHLPHEMAHYLAYFCEGRIGSALRLKDTDILEHKNRVIDEFILGERPFSPERVFGKEREQMRGALNIVAAWFRDVYAVKTGLPHSQLINLDRKDELLGSMNRYTWPRLETIMDSISDSLFYLERNISTKLLFFNLRMLIWQRWS